MEKRLLLAMVLMAAAILLTNILFPPPDPPATPEAPEVVETPESPTATAISRPSVAVPVAVGDTVAVSSELYRYLFTTRGAALLRAELPAYRSYSVPEDPVQLIPTGATDFLAHRLVVGRDTIDLRALPFTASTRALVVGDAEDERVLEFVYQDAEGFAVTLRYRFQLDGYLIDAAGRVEGLGGQTAQLLTDLGPGLEMHDHLDHHAEREFAVVTRDDGGVDRVAFKGIEGRSTIGNPLHWAGIKDKYFLAALIAGETTPLAGAVVTRFADLPRLMGETEIVVPRVQLTTVLPIAADGAFSFQTYIGPQDYYGRLTSIGYDLQDVTKYGYRWLEPVIRPLAAAVLWVLKTLHDTLGIAYGWVLVIFGVMMRIVLWPLNAKAMRAQMKNMALQPILQEIREKYKNDPEKQQQAMLAFYKEHKFNPFGGCLPLLVPFPVLITLFFVFQNTIAFRGAGFLWLPDISLRDPYYILPVVLVVSMFALQWVSVHLSGMEQNPQMKMMLYVMPVMMGLFFFMFPAGLNLYYAVTQIASLPQQILIARERGRAQAELKKSGGPKFSMPVPAAGKSKPKPKR